MMERASVNRCRPGWGASCSLCCGSHNYTLPPDLIGDIFLSRERDSAEMTLHPEESLHEKLVPEAMQCPLIGIDPSGPGLIGCSVYTHSGRNGRLESFFTGTCKSFQCSAWDELTDRQVLFAAELTGDWYYYGLLINDIETVAELCAAYVCPGDVPPEVLESIKMELNEKLLVEGSLL